MLTVVVERLHSELRNGNGLHELVHFVEAFCELILRALSFLLHDVGTDRELDQTVVFLGQLVALLSVLAEHDVDEFKATHFSFAHV